MKLFWKIILGLGIMTAGIALIVLVKLDDREQANKTEILTSIEEQARPIKVKINKLEAEISEMARQIPAQVPQIADVFVVHNSADMDAVEELMEWYSFFPSIVIDSEMQEEENLKMLSWIQKRGYGIVLSVETWDDSAEEKIDRVRTVLNKYGLIIEACLIPKDFNTVTNRGLLKKKGISKIIVEDEKFAAGVTEDGVAYIPFFYGNDRDIIKIYGNTCLENVAMGVCVFDFKWADMETMYDYVDAWDDFVYAYQANYSYKANYTSLAEMLQKQTDIASGAMTQQKKDCEIYISERQEEIAKLQSELEEIYNQWSE